MTSVEDMCSHIGYHRNHCHYFMENQHTRNNIINKHNVSIFTNKETTIQCLYFASLNANCYFWQPYTVEAGNGKFLFKYFHKWHWIHENRENLDLRNISAIWSAPRKKFDNYNILLFLTHCSFTSQGGKELTLASEEWLEFKEHITLCAVTIIMSAHK